MKPQIDSVTITGTRRLGLSVTNDPKTSHYDLDLSGKPTQDYKTDVIYQTGQAVQKPALITKSSSLDPLLLVQVSNIDSAYRNKVLKLESAHDASAAFCMSSEPLRPSDTEGDTVTFKLFNKALLDNSDPNNPYCLGGENGLTQFDLYCQVGSDWAWLGDATLQDIPLELYVIHYELPNYFTDGVPLLLLRLFVAAATKSNAATAHDWVALVTRICHGSALPVTGARSETENHWLKYHIWGGDCAFIHPHYNKKFPYTKYYNYGGYFLLDAWLNRYRDFKAKGIITLINCYDQAGAVEVALSLGINYRNVAWEYHQTYGFISRNAELVGWGKCNSPYFSRSNLKTKLLDEQAEDRTFFRNHAFLSWNPEFKPAGDEFFAKHSDPSAWTEQTMFAIDACAGPCLGDLARGVWVDPGKLPEGYSTNPPKTYWKTRDDNFNKVFKTNEPKMLLDPKKDSLHYWLPGITGCNNNGKAGESADFTVFRREDSRSQTGFDYVDPLADSGIKFPTAGELYWPLDVMGGRSSDIEGWFLEYLQQNLGLTSEWKRISEGNIALPTTESREVRFHDPDRNSVNFYSLDITAANTIDEAIESLKRRARQIVIVSVIDTEDFKEQRIQQPNGEYYTRDVFLLHADYTSLLVCDNLMVEVSGTAPTKILKPLAEFLGRQMMEVNNIPFLSNRDGWRGIMQS